VSAANARLPAAPKKLVAKSGTHLRISRSRALDRLFCALAVAVYLWQTWRFWFLIDDAFISYRYARNLARGFELVYNQVRGRAR
jgi:hypothetical protein